MKRALAAMLLVLSLAACGDNGQPSSKDKAAPAPAADTGGRTPSPAGAKVFLEPQAGQLLSDKVLDAGADQQGNLQFSIADQG